MKPPHTLYINQQVVGNKTKDFNFWLALNDILTPYPENHTESF